MLGILFIIFIGRFFYKLAEKYNQNKWLFTILGVLMYYVGSAVGGLIIGFASMFFGFQVDWDNTILMTLIALPFGFGFCYLFYFLLEKTWKKNKIEPVESIDQIGQE